MSLSNVASTLAGETLTAATNGTRASTSIDVITANSFNVNLNTTAVTLPDNFRDRSADGDRAYVKIDEGVDLNNNGTVDFRTPGQHALRIRELHRHELAAATTKPAATARTRSRSTRRSSAKAITTSPPARFASDRDGGPDVFTRFQADDLRRSIEARVGRHRVFSNGMRRHSRTRDAEDQVRSIRPRRKVHVLARSCRRT